MSLKNKKQRDLLGLFLVEGFKEIEFALRNGFISCEFWGTEGNLRSFSESGAENYCITEELFKKIGYRESTDSILGVFKKKEFKPEHLFCSGSKSLIFVAENINKPGNMGALFRIADGVGADGIIFTEQESDLYNPNVIRNSVGTFFSVPFLFLKQNEVKKLLHNQGYQIIVATPEAENNYTKLKYSLKTALVVGNEHQGVNDFWKINADKQIFIPMLGENDSLNVSVSTAIIAYEWRRQYEA